MKSPGWTRLFVALAGVTALASGSAGAASAPAGTHAAAQAFSVQVLVAGKPVAGTAAAKAPPDASALGQSYAYPSDGSVVSTGRLAATARTDTGSTRASAEATSSLTVLSLFGGEITAVRASVRATAWAGPRSGDGRITGTGLTGLVVLGQALNAAPNQRIPLADWGYAVALASEASPAAPSGRKAYGDSVTALDVHLTAAHGGLAAGSEVRIGYAQGSAQAPAEKPKPVDKHKPPHHKTKHHAHPHTHHKLPKPPEPKPSPFGPPPVQAPPKQPKKITVTLGGYVFPVFGPVSFTDTFGAARADVGWHHGDDIFAPLGAPIVAVAKGTVFSVGWNNIGGNRLWLKDRQGNEFYYAHLSAFSPLAVNGARVSAGDVLGFVGNTGDAVGTPYHLHFEIHPESMLGMGYDGVINPTRYLQAWQHVRDLAFPGLVARSRASEGSRAPQPGAILLHVSDISSARSLRYEALKKVLYASRHTVVADGDNFLVGAPSSGG